MVTFAVPPKRVRSFVPAEIEIDLRQDDNGTAWALVSAVMFENHGAGPGAPWLRCLRGTFPQVNYRLYVRRDGRAGAWFFRVVMGTPQAAIQRRLFHAPTYSAAIAVRHEWDATRATYRSYRFECSAPPHRLTANLAAGDALVAGTLFGSADEMTAWLTMRPDGYFHDPAGRYLSYMPVRHEAMRPVPGRMIEFSSEVLDTIGVVAAAEQARPYAVFFQPAIDLFGEYPRRIKAG
jgi:uncharacterized protein YqjF (DUF2071 family)